MSKLESVMLGDNPFFGVDHLSHERARKRALNHQTFDGAVRVIETAFDLCMKDMVVGTRPRLSELIECIEKTSNILDKIQFNPILPYAQDYILKVSEKGLIGALKEILGGVGIKNEFKFLTKGGLGFLKKDMDELFKVLIDVELSKLKKVKIKTIYLHPLVTDLALSLNFKDFFEIFRDYLHNSYHVDVGLSTKNFSWLVTKLDDWNITFEDIMTSFNKAGYLMNPSREKCEKTLASYDGEVTAMNIFAGGYIGLDETFKYIVSLPKISKVVVGASTVEHARQTFELFTN